MENNRHRMFLEALEDRHLLAAIVGTSIDHLHWVDGNAEAVTVAVTAPAGASAPGAPTATGKISLDFDEPTGGYQLSLLTAFDDMDAPKADLVFSVIGYVGDPIFESLTVDDDSGSLRVGLVADARGQATIDVLAKDEDGHVATARLSLHANDVSPQVTQPNLRSFTVANNGDGTYTFSGSAAGPGNLTAVFGEDLEGTTAPLGESGSFAYVVTDTDLEAGGNSGWVTVHIENGIGATSETLAVRWQR